MRQNNNGWRVKQVGVDVVDDTNALPAENFLCRRLEVCETYNDAMNGDNVITLTRPLKRLMNEVDDNALAEKIRSKRRDGNALPDRICSDERTISLLAVNEVSDFFESARHVVKVVKTGNASEDLLLSGRKSKSRLIISYVVS